MDFKFLILFLTPLLLFSQRKSNFEIFAYSSKEDMVNIEIKNNSLINRVIYIDIDGVHFSCSKEDVWKNTFLRPNLCVKLPKKFYIDEKIGVCVHCEGNYGFYSNMNMDDYMKSKVFNFTPLELKKISYNINDSRFLDKKNKLFTLNAKIILYEFEIKGDSVKLKNPIESNEFLLKIRLMKK